VSTVELPSAPDISVSLGADASQPMPPLNPQAISSYQVRLFRKRALRNGYGLVRVRSASKAPLAAGWQHGEPRESLLDVREDAFNTGVLLGDLLCVDLDIDDPQVTLEVERQAERHLPPGALIRRRAGSSRLSMFHRSAVGQPRKRVIEGTKGKIEILGLGQQAVIDGLHPTGARITWRNGRGPDTVAFDRVPEVSEAQISAFLDACAPLLKPSSAKAGRPAASDGSALEAEWKLPRAAASMPLDNDLAAGIGDTPNWFGALSPESKFEVVEACLNALDNRSSDTREVWLRVLFAVADAERLGCPDARQSALEWSQRGASWTTEADFEMAWASYKPKPGGITVGSLLAMADGAGLDLSQWRDPVLSQTPVARLANQSAAATPSPASVSALQRALPATALPLVPPKRHWLHGTDLARGAIALLVAPGARGKSSLLVTLALACAANRPLLGANVFGGPLCVLFISAEDPLSELALRIRAAMQHHGLTDSDVPGLYVIGADDWGIPLLRPGTSGPTLNTAGWDELTAELDRLEPDVLIIDPLITVMGGASQNDNAAAALFMGQLVGLAAKRRIGVMVAHHAAKGRDPISPESAMGAASFVNLSRIALGIEPLAANDAGNVGLPPWEARHVFRLVSTKQNLSPPAEGDRWFRLQSVEMNNAEPPIYLNGDKVGVVEVFQPGASGATFSAQIIKDTLLAIDNAPIPLSPSKRATGRYAVPLITQALARHRGGRASDIEAEAVLDHLIRTGLVAVQQVKLARAGGRSDFRSGLVLTFTGKQELDAGQTAHSTANPPAIPASPATFVRDDAGGDPLGPPQQQGGCGGNAEEIVAEARRTERPSNPLQRDGSSLPHVGQPTLTPSAAQTRAATELASVDIAARPRENAPKPPARSTEPAAGSELRSSASKLRTPAPSDATPALAGNEDGLDIPPFLARTQPAAISSEVTPRLPPSPCGTRTRLCGRPKYFTNTPLNPLTTCQTHSRNSRRPVGSRSTRAVHRRVGSLLV
jgi:hypothetical protein